MKKLIFYATCTYMIIIVVAMSLNIIFEPKTIDFMQLEVYEAEIKELEEKADILEEGSCKNSIKELIRISKTTYYTGKIKLKDIYNAQKETGIKWLSSYIAARDACGKDSVDAVENATLAAAMQTDELLQRYMNSYILKIKTSSSEDIFASMNFIENGIKKYIELDTLRFLIEGDNYE